MSQMHHLLKALIYVTHKMHKYCSPNSSFKRLYTEQSTIVPSLHILVSFSDHLKLNFIFDTALSIDSIILSALHSSGSLRDITRKIGLPSTHNFITKSSFYLRHQIICYNNLKYFCLVVL